MFCWFSFSLFTFLFIQFKLSFTNHELYFVSIFSIQVKCPLSMRLKIKLGTFYFTRSRRLEFYEESPIFLWNFQFWIKSDKKIDVEVKLIMTAGTSRRVFRFKLNRKKSIVQILNSNSKNIIFLIPVWIKFIVLWVRTFQNFVQYVTWK